MKRHREWLLRINMLPCFQACPGDTIMTPRICQVYNQSDSLISKNCFEGKIFLHRIILSILSRAILVLVHNADHIENRMQGDSAEVKGRDVPAPNDDGSDPMHQGLRFFCNTRNIFS